MENYYKIEKEGIRIRHSAKSELTAQIMTDVGLQFGNITRNANSRYFNEETYDSIKKKVQIEIDKIGGNKKHFTTEEWNMVEVNLYRNILIATKLDYFNFIKQTYERNFQFVDEWIESDKLWNEKNKF